MTKKTEKIIQPLTQSELEINFIYHMYAGVFEDMNLSDVDMLVYRFIPRSIWDNNCDHKYTCIHQVVWRRYCTTIIDHIVKLSTTIPEYREEFNNMDILNLLLWFCINTNIVMVLVGSYESMNINELIIATGEQKDNYKLFAKYLKVIPREIG